MLRKLPIVSCPLRLGGFELLGPAGLKELSQLAASILKASHTYFTNSATTAFYLILEVLKGYSAKREVVLPAYTAASLVHAIQRAGLKPVLCDVSLDDFNFDISSLAERVNNNTLAMVAVHMFGIPFCPVPSLKQRFPEIFIVEDCAQSLGSSWEGKPAGSFGDAAFFSFNRGKNLPTYGGGCLATSNEQLASEFAPRVDSLPGPTLLFNLFIPLKIAALAALTNPLFYALADPVLAPFKARPPLADFPLRRYTRMQARTAMGLLKRLEELSETRYNNGMRLINGLKGKEGVATPIIDPRARPAFNRLPMVFKDLSRRAQVEQRLVSAGIESSRMYPAPLHQSFALGYQKEDFPNALYLAEHLLTLPAHPLVSDKDLDKIIEIIRES